MKLQNNTHLNRQKL